MMARTLTASDWRPVRQGAPAPQAIAGPSPAKRRADILACADALQRGLTGRGAEVETTDLRALILHRTLHSADRQAWPIPEVIAERLARMILSCRTRPGFSPSPLAHREAIRWFERHLARQDSQSARWLPGGVVPPRSHGFLCQGDA